MKFGALFFLCLLLAFPGMTQRSCGTVEYNTQLNNAYPDGPQKQLFEQWIKDKLKINQGIKAVNGETDSHTTYTVPVVVHVIHFGEPVGTGRNIAFEQIESQIEVLNEDFARLNADTVNTPDMFKSVASDVSFEFVLAKQDPNGQATNGVTRTMGTQASWPSSSYNAIKALSYWDSNNYLNIWVADYALLGIAQFPETAILDGLENASSNPLTDGVVITYEAFGSVEKYPTGDYLSDFDRGRTASHEIGHFFGLRHMWGDGDATGDPGCDVDDYVSDTPNAEDRTFNCPVLGASTTTCGSQDMFMNYMDYVDDDCMNIFTMGQRDRMHVIINNSPRRLSLLTSPGLEDPLSTDASLLAIISPEANICSDIITPQLLVTNSGTNDITSLLLSVGINDSTYDEVEFKVNLSTQDSIVLNVDSFVYNSTCEFNFTSNITAVNGSPDEDESNNTLTKSITRSELVTSLDEDFENWPSNWQVKSEAPLSAWNIEQAPNLTLTNQAAKLNYYQNTSGETDALITPALDLSQQTNPYLQFQWAYAYRAGFLDKLEVEVSTNCGTSYDNTLITLSGASLKTTEQIIEFNPSGPRDWRSQTLDLSAFVGQQILIQFKGTPDGGNHIYLDNVKLIDQAYIDVSLVDLVNSAATYCSQPSEVGLIIGNQGIANVNQLTLSVDVNNSGAPTQYLYNDLNITADARDTLLIPVDFVDGDEVLFTIETLDSVSSNNQINRILQAQSFRAELPQRERFENGSKLQDFNWLATADTEVDLWELTTTSDGNQSVFYNAFNAGDKGVLSWLISPIYDFSSLIEASMRFDVSYARNGNANELLRIWASTNCGHSFNILLGELEGKDLAVKAESNEWQPSSSSDWVEQYIGLDTLVGISDVMLAFEIIDADGNNMFLDNIELFITDEEFPVKINSQSVAAYPNPISNGLMNITFNLEQKEAVSIDIINTIGSVVYHYDLNDVLNQTFDLDMSTTDNGAYYMRINSPSISETIALVISQ